MDAGPEVVSWQLLEPQLLFILVNYQDYQFAGTLMLEARCSACIPANRQCSYHAACLVSAQSSLSSNLTRVHITSMRA